MTPDATDRRILKATAGGLSLNPHPFAEVGRWLFLPEAEVIARMQAMQDNGVIRRVALSPNHAALGPGTNGMSVWDLEDAVAEALGAEVGALPFVSHCSLRPRALPDWPYNLFAILHGHDREEVGLWRDKVAAHLGDAGATTSFIPPAS
jgi:siroheme decarboxylase